MSKQTGNKVPAGGKAVGCMFCDKKSCPFAGFSENFQIRICPVLNAPDKPESIYGPGKLQVFIDERLN